MVQQPAALVPPATGGCPATGASAGFNQSNVEIRFQLAEPANQAATGQSSADNGEINFSHSRWSFLR